ncbi:5'/3'-nucleotidase SurE [Candidatus Dojkabacteria bacterium]|nr:5'/3'-nucleotidase SurE [Candidatus Dojkabacteria bacterium]
MEIKRILLTGDDGYNSLGIRVLCEVLKDKYELFIVATKRQQSAVGGLLTMSKDPHWEKTKVDGIDAISVDGSPVDCMEFAQGYFDKKFDLIISGINWGENVTHSIISSGTFCAGVRGVGVGVAPRAVVMSLVTNSENFLRNHSSDDSIEDFIKYPGEAVKMVLDGCIENNFYGSKYVNVNFPDKPSSEVKITRVAEDITRYWSYPVRIDEKKGIFSAPSSTYSSNLETNVEYDSGALSAGFISVSPIRKVFGGK